ncbi:SPOR domain-containing protein [Prevotella intermedia]|uniref:Cell division protein n=1 Tax=Prevotella intermedia TaxID=28131 RepID=A0A2D3L4J4_PREIN|nr:SPOR domain-containing protein [Prevotella intermedia]ATV25497.1 cell division protein [Prevotella intermedia]
MLRIDRHIEILLLENDCIIVPGLGGFVAYHSEARYEQSDNIYLPPYRTVGFNPVLRMNDSLLAQSYIEAYDLSYPEAMREIETEVDSILNTLEEVGQLELKGLGVLKREGDNKITFEPYEGGLLTPKFYGFSSFEIAKSSNVANIDIEKTSIHEKVEKKPQVICIDTNNQGDKRLSVSLKAVKDLAVAAVLISFVFIVGLTAEKHNTPQRQEVKSGMFYNIFDSNNINKNQPTTSKGKVISKNETPVTPSKHYWSLVLASHITERNAKSFVKKLHSNGFADACVYTGAGSTKVVYGKYRSAQLAAEKLNNLRGNANFKQAWILEIGK